VRAAESFTAGYECRFSRDLIGGQALSHLQGARSDDMSDDSLEARQVRLAKNQALFRAVNEEVENIAENQTDPGPISFVCECATPDCGSPIELAHGEYEAIRRDPKHFFVLAGHVFPEVENIIDDRGRYVVVEKFGAGGRVAAAVGDERNTGEAD
jgi:hypothetical protein